MLHSTPESTSQGPAHTIYNPEAAYQAQAALMAPTRGLAPPPLKRPAAGDESDDEPEAKRQKIMGSMVPEAEFARANAGPLVLLIALSPDLQIPDTTELEVTLKATTKVDALKKSLATQLGLKVVLFGVVILFRRGVFSPVVSMFSEDIWEPAFRYMLVGQHTFRVCSIHHHDEMVAR